MLYKLQLMRVFYLAPNIMRLYLQSYLILNFYVNVLYRFKIMIYIQFDGKHGHFYDKQFCRPIYHRISTEKLLTRLLYIAGLFFRDANRRANMHIFKT